MMDELIRKQTVLNMIDDVQFGNITHKLSQLHEAVFNLPSAQQWISCSERLPEKHKTVLITHRGGVSFGWHNGKHWERGASQNHRPLQTVVAWMPLPEPYKEVQE